MGNQVIGGRQVVVKRSGTSMTTVTTHSTNGTYSTSTIFFGPASYTFTAHFSQVGNGDIAPSDATGVTVTWSSAYC
jgi:hypothetical protein